jgi:hypothetical protein
MSDSASPVLLILGRPLGLAPFGRVAAAVPLRWPNKLANTVRLYGVDAVNILGTDSIKSASAASMPSELNGLTLSVPVVNGSQVTLLIGGGAPGTDYGVTLRIVLTSGQQLEENIGLFIPIYPYPTVQ